MKMLKVLKKVVKFYIIADGFASWLALCDYYSVTGGYTMDHSKRKYKLGKFTQYMLNAGNYDYRLMANKFGIIIDDSKDEEDHLEILNVDDAKRMMA